MSGKVLVVPEDPTLNGHILRPFVKRVLDEAKFPAREVHVLEAPRTRGFQHAIQTITDDAFIERYKKFYSLWLFVPDGDLANDQAMRDLETRLSERGVTLVCQAAVPELEAWLLAGSDVRFSEAWGDMRSARDFKERYAEPFIRSHGNPKAAGLGRGRLAVAALGNWNRVTTRCPELGQLVERLRNL